jgi:hypothetical protein
MAGHKQAFVRHLLRLSALADQVSWPVLTFGRLRLERLVVPHKARDPVALESPS